MCLTSTHVGMHVHVHVKCCETHHWRMGGVLPVCAVDVSHIDSRQYARSCAREVL